MKVRDGYLLFWGITEIYSQWYASEFVAVDDNQIQKYNCCEQYMMAKKAELFNDLEIRNLIMKEKSPRKIKNLGRKVKNFKEDKWKSACDEIVYKGNYYKFSQNQDLKQQLLETKDLVIVEASPLDFIWGIGLDENHPDATNPSKWKGKNKLGKAIMRVREELLNAKN